MVVPPRLLTGGITGEHVSVTKHSLNTQRLPVALTHVHGNSVGHPDSSISIAHLWVTIHEGKDRGPQGRGGSVQLVSVEGVGLKG